MFTLNIMNFGSTPAFIKMVESVLLKWNIKRCNSASELYTIDSVPLTAVLFGSTTAHFPRKARRGLHTLP